MTVLDVRINLETEPWRDLPPGPHIVHGHITRVGLLPDGTTGGRPSVAIVGETSDGQVILVETTWALFNTAARALAASPEAQRFADEP